jgi:hypothetical protein
MVARSSRYPPPDLEIQGCVPPAKVSVTGIAHSGGLVTGSQERKILGGPGVLKA